MTAKTLAKIVEVALTTENPKVEAAMLKLLGKLAEPSIAKEQDEKKEKKSEKE